MTVPAIVTKNLSKIVATADSELKILDNINLSLNTGESLAIVGSSGAGKSTLLGLLAGLDVPTSGSIHLAGQEITSLDEEERAAVRAGLVGFVFQTFQLLPSLNALENVALPLELRGEKTAEKQAAEFLDRVGLSDRLKHYPRTLSGGEQQRVAIARAFACQPKILFADEPTGNLDSKTGQKVSDLLFEINQEAGATLVLVTHDHGLAQRCQNILHLEAGHIEID